MTRSHLLLAATLTMLATTAFVPARSFAQTDPAKVVIAQMMQDDKGMKSSGMQGQGMQGQGMGMEGHGMSGSNMQNAPAPGGCPGGQCGAMQGSGMPGQMSGAMGPGATMGPQMMQMMMHGRMADLPADHIEGRIAYLHAELKITEAQMPAWTEFANVVRANAKRIAEAQKAPQQTTTADRLDNQERWLTARLESVKALKPAYAKLYAALDDSQKKTADELIAPHMGIR